MKEYGMTQDIFEARFFGREEELKSLRNKLVEAGTINKEEIRDFLEGKK